MTKYKIGFNVMCAATIRIDAMNEKDAREKFDRLHIDDAIKQADLVIHGVQFLAVDDCRLSPREVVCVTKAVASREVDETKSSVSTPFGSSERKI